MAGSVAMSFCLASVSCRPSGQLLLQKDARGPVGGEKPLPAAPSENPHGLAVFSFGVALELGDQRQPLVPVLSAASDDGAEALAVDRAQLSHCGRLDHPAIPSNPDERVTGLNGAINVGDVADAAPPHRRCDQWRNVRPEFMNTGRIDADQLTFTKMGANALIPARHSG